MNTHTGSLSYDSLSTLKSELDESNFQGKISLDLSDRISMSTDNSLYQVLPSMVIKPESIEDVQPVLEILSKTEYAGLSVTVRAGGTGTNGQSLNSSLILDMGRHLSSVRELNLEDGWIDVDAGIILGDLNQLLRPKGYFFAPTTSTANRCSIGGMIGTDAAGKGSRIYGKTSDHVLGLDVLLISGERLWLEPKSLKELGSSPADDLYRKLYEICSTDRALVQETFPKINRRLSGYDLETTITDDGVIDPTRMICGSEGTLAFVLGARLKLTAIPKYKKLVILAYSDFIDAVSSAQTLLSFEPDAIETVDGVIQQKAMEGPLGKLLPEDFHAASPGLTPPICNFIEFSGDDEKQVLANAQRLYDHAKNDSKIIAAHIVTHASDQATFWNARKAAVGLLADCPPGPQPAAFVEDCVVPPEKLADFLREFRGLLDEQKTSYGMFGHVDVGCIHVRPAINQNKQDVTKQVRDISDKVQALARKYGGLLWGEHGKGFRGEYLEETVGADVYQIMRKVKTLFDPLGRLNPGKLASPLDHKDIPIVRIDEAPMRAERNRQVPDNERLEDYADVFRCNGNAQCLNSVKTLAMCPSFKATEDYRYSPKGRSDLLREWLRLKANKDGTLRSYEKEIYPVLDACLSCKACTSSCPVHVDMPELKSRFLEEYHSRHGRTWRDFSLSKLEDFSRLVSSYPFFANLIMRNPISKVVSEKVLGIVDAPAASVPSIHKRLQCKQARIWSPAQLVKALRGGEIMSPPPKDKLLSPIVLIDGFNIAYDADALNDIYSGLVKLGFYPFMVYAGASGKALHVKGYRKAFKKKAQKHAQDLNALIALGMPVIVAESSYLATLTKDFSCFQLDTKLPDILPLHKYLQKHIHQIQEQSFVSEGKKAKFFAHCTEKTSMPDIHSGWKDVLNAAGVDVQMVDVGCCGMSGAYGHEEQHQKSSRALYDLTWKENIERESIDGLLNEQILATGFSCRCQVKRFSDKKARHPLSAVL